VHDVRAVPPHQVPDLPNRPAGPHRADGCPGHPQAGEITWLGSPRRDLVSRFSKESMLVLDHSVLS
jgi:hypothetical protein